MTATVKFKRGLPLCSRGARNAEEAEPIHKEVEPEQVDALPAMKHPLKRIVEELRAVIIGFGFRDRRRDQMKRASVLP